MGNIDKYSHLELVHALNYQAIELYRGVDVAHKLLPERLSLVLLHLNDHKEILLTQYM